MNAIDEHIQNHAEKYQLIASKKLKQAGWVFKDEELIA